MLDRISDPNLRAYVVWLPVLPWGGWESAARREARRISDARATRYYDREARLAKLYSPILHLPEGMPAYDVYLVFGPAARWPEPREGSEGREAPPAPTYWMHQLGRSAPPELRLDGEQLARVINGLITGAGGGHPVSLRAASPAFAPAKLFPSTGTF